MKKVKDIWGHPYKVERKEQSNNIYEIQISYVKGRRSAARAWRIAQRGERPEEVMGGKPPSKLMAWCVLTKKRTKTNIKIKLYGGLISKCILGFQRNDTGMCITMCNVSYDC